MLTDVQWLVLIALVTGILLYRSAVRRQARGRSARTSPDGSSSAQPDPYSISAMDGSRSAGTRDRRAADDRADGDRANDSSDGDVAGGDGGGSD